MNAILSERQTVLCHLEHTSIQIFAFIHFVSAPQALQCMQLNRQCSSLAFFHLPSRKENPLRFILFDSSHIVDDTHFISVRFILTFLLLQNCRVFDRDGNGYITRDELQTAMEMIQENVTETQVNEMLQLADLDKDGKINYEGKWLGGTNASRKFPSVGNYEGKFSD